MAQQVAQPGGADPARPRCSWRSRCEPRSDFESLRWIITSRPRPIRASNSSRKASAVVRIGEVDAGAPGMGGVEAEAEPRFRRCPVRPPPRRSRPAPSTSTPSPNPPPAEFSSTTMAASGPSSTSARTRRRPSARRSVPGFDAGSAMRPDVDVDEPGAKAGRRAQLAGEDRDRARVEVLVRAGQVDQVGRVDRDRPDVQLGQPLLEGRQLPAAVRSGGARRSGCRRRPGSRLRRSRGRARRP